MAALILTTLQSQFMTSLEAPLLSAFGDGVVLPGGNPASIAGFKGFNDLSADQKLTALNGMKSTFAPLIAKLVADETPVYTEVTFQNGFSAWGDGNYGAGTVRYYKDPRGYVHVHGLVRAPSTGTLRYAIMFYLPAGFQPVNGDSRIFACAMNETLAANIEVSWSGGVRSLTDISYGAWISLDFSFYAGG